MTEASPRVAVPDPPWLNRDQWEPITAPLTVGANARTGAALLQVVLQFLVETARRYQPTSVTFCNIFLWDVTRALSCEIPHWVRGRELDANMVIDWLRGTLANGGSGQGPRQGWRAVLGPDGKPDAALAQARADRGYPTVVTYHAAANRIGHVAVLVPRADGHTDGVWISQAGRTCFAYNSLASGFGNLPVEFFTHD